MSQLDTAITQTLASIKHNSSVSANKSSKDKKVSDKYSSCLGDENDLNKLTNIIFESNLFDCAYYAHQTGEYLNIKAAIKHFLLEGAEKGLRPFPSFNVDDYRSINKDFVTLSNSDCFVHYADVGIKEKRYFNKKILKLDAMKVCESQYFDEDWYCSLLQTDLEGVSVQEHFLSFGWRNKKSANAHFDDMLYLSCYSDARESPVPPFLHYITHEPNLRISCKQDLERMITPIVESGEFNQVFYHRKNKKIMPNGLSDIAHFYCQSDLLKLDPNSSFSTDYYLSKYPDLVGKIPNSFCHYISNGRNEGRKGKFEPAQYITNGHIEFDFNKPTILLVCHEASRSGAPIVGLRLLEQLMPRANVISWLGKNGELTEDFVKSSVATINTFGDRIDNLWLVRELKIRYELDVAILNSACTLPVVTGLYEEKVPTVALVHEYADYMGSDMLTMLLAANRIVFPSESVKLSADKLSQKPFGNSRNNITVRHQGRCFPPTGNKGNNYSVEDILFKLGISEADEKPIIVLGCGWVQIRKGVEYFIETARLCKELTDKPTKFIWVGGGYKPDTDLGYSVWLKSQIVQSGLESDVIFFEETDDLDVFFELADVFFLSSRLDPFPNVALDAVNANVPIVVFEGGTGFAEFIQEFPKVGNVAPYLDCHAAAKSIMTFSDKQKQGRSTQIDKSIKERLSFASYADFVWDECMIAKEHQNKINVESDHLTQLRLLDETFFKSAFPTPILNMSPEYIYVANWARGIRTAKSRVGFNDQIAMTQLAVESDNESLCTITPLTLLLEKDLSPLTHKVLYVGEVELTKKWEGDLSVALHIHAYNTAGLTVLLKSLGNLGQKISIFVTTDKEDKVKEIVNAASALSLDVTVLIVPNRGRDIAPFIMMFNEHFSKFDVVGHFHLKNTKELEQKVVKQWQQFLLNTLIGKSGEVLNTVLNAFEKEPKMGLFFQEDPCLPNWGKNKEYATDLLNSLKIDRSLPEFIEYPTGNMFWVRTKALIPFFNKEWQWADFTREPVPYDGSVLHAIERIITIICEEAGYEWSTVYNPISQRYSE